MRTPAIGAAVKLYGYPDEYTVVNMGCATGMNGEQGWCPNGEAAITLRSLSRAYESTMCFSVMSVTHIDGQSVANLVSAEGTS